MAGEHWGSAPQRFGVVVLPDLGEMFRAVDGDSTSSKANNSSTETPTRVVRGDCVWAERASWEPSVLYFIPSICQVRKMERI